MRPRTELQALLENILGSSNVYFQAPPAHEMKYPCIVYRRDYKYNNPANNKPYVQEKRYLITVMDYNPDSLIPDRIGALPKCIFDRHYTADNLNHDVYKLFF